MNEIARVLDISTLTTFDADCRIFSPAPLLFRVAGNKVK